MPRNQGFSAISANRRINLNIRTIHTILTILSILRFTLAQERKTFNYDDDNKGYSIDKGDVSYIVTPNYENDKIDLSDENINRYWTIEEEPKERYFWLRKRKNEERKVWKKDQKYIMEDKSGLASIISMNAFDGVKEIKYLKSRGRKKKNRRKITEREKRNNVESSRSEEDRNSNNSMTVQRTSRNRKKEPGSKGTESERFELKGPRSSRILRGFWIKRESIREKSNALPSSRKALFSLNELDEFLSEKKKDRHFYFYPMDRRKYNSSIINSVNDQKYIQNILNKSYETWNKDKLYENDQIQHLNYIKESSGFKDNQSFMKSFDSFKTKEQRERKCSIKTNDQTKSDLRISKENKLRIIVRPKEDYANKTGEKKTNSFHGNEEEVSDMQKNMKKRKYLKENNVKSFIRDRRNVDKFSNDATVPSYPTTKETIKLKTRESKIEEEEEKEEEDEEASSVMSLDREEVSKDTVGLWYKDNSELKKVKVEEEEEEEVRRDAIEIRLRKKTENKEVGTMRERIGKRNLSEDKKEKEGNKTAYLDLNSEKEVNVVVPRNFSKEKQDESKKIKSYGGRKIQEKEIRSGKEFFELTGHFDLTEGSLRNYLKEEGQGGGGDGGGDGGGGGHTFSHEEVTSVTEKEMKNVSSDLEENGKETILLSPPINYLKKEKETVKIVPPSIKNGGNRKDQEKEVTSTRIVNVSKDNTVSWNSKENRKYDDTTSDSDRLNSSRMSIHEIDSQVRSFKDSQRNVRDPSGDFVSPRSVDYSTSYFPKDTKGGELRDDPSSDWNGHEMKEVVKEEEEEDKEEEKEKGEGKRRYHEKKIKSKDSQRKFWLKDEEQMVENTTISLNDLPKLTPLTFPNIITDERKETIKRTNSEVSDYKGEVNRMKLPMIENKFTSSFPSTLNETEQEVSSNKKSIKSSTLLLSKKKRFKSTEKIESNTDPTINLSTNFNTSIRNQLLDSITITEEENFETYSPRGNSMGTTDISMTEKSKRTSRIPNSLTNRSFSSVEIVGFTYPFSDVVTSQSIDTFTTISIDENTLDKKFENTTSASSVWLSTVSLEKTTIGNVSVNKQSINDDHNSTNKPPWPVKHSAVVEGDLVLGGLMMVHEREDSVKCGPIMPQGGVQALEAMLYTLDTLNQREIVPGVKIGAHILDDCDKDTYGLEMAVDFIKGSISNIDGAEYHCNKTTVRKVISGVVGAASSVTSIQVANLLRLFRIPQVSFFSTSPELSNKQRFEYFSRTIPSDHYQVKAMVDIVLKMGWSYVSIIYEESNYGIKAFEELEELLTKNNICIAVKEKLVKDSGVAEETAYDTIVSKLLTKPRAKGCIIFGSDQEVAGVMRAVRRCNATGSFSWIGSDGWSARGLVSNGNEAEVEGTLSVQPQANPVMGFEEYFLNLTVENNKRNPWFVEFWEDHFQCRYPNSTLTPHNQKYTKACSTKERLTKENTVFEDQLQFVSDAVMAFAHAFRDMHRDLCGNKTGLCSAMKPTEGTKLLEYLRKVQFKGLSGDEFRFDENGDGPARYNIIHFKQTEPGVYKWIRVGKYLEGVLHLNMSMVQFKLGHNQTPESVCSVPCEVGQAKKYVEGESCCWHCFNCSQYQIRHPDDETQCKNCQQGTLPDETHSTCSEIPEEFLRLESGWAIGAMSFSAVGILVTLFVCGVFLKHNDTPVVRASGRELSYVLLIGILLCYLVTFALVLRPTDIVCSIQRFSAGFCFTVVYAALLTKTNRISRIFNAGKHSAKRPSFISPNSQLIICSGLVGVQILINVVWIVIDPAKAMHHYPTKEDNLLVCNSYIDASYMIAFAYPIILIVVCTIYAILTRKIPEAFNESKYIGFTMYTTCVIWLAFVPLYFGTGNHVALRITSMSVTISLSASLTIACLFTPKLYIILIRPDRNVRQNIMPPRPYNTTKSSAVTGTNASSMMATITLTAVTCDQNKAVKKHIIKTTDCSTQSEYYELELKERKNGKSAPNLISRGTQTQSNNNEKETNDGVHLVVDKESKETAITTRQINNTKIGNGPVNQNDVAL